VVRLCTILEPGKLTAVRACFPIAIVILLATFACTGGTGSDYPNAANDPGASPRADAGVRDPGDEEEDAAGPSGGGSLDAGAAHEEADAGRPSTDHPCTAPSDAGDAGDSGDTDGGVSDANVDAQGVDAEADAGDGAADAGDAATDAEPARDAEVDTGANFPDAAGDAELPLSDASGDAAHTTSEGGPCVP
jgi:hypothetical protein